MDESEHISVICTSTVVCVCVCTSCDFSTDCISYIVKSF